MAVAFRSNPMVLVDRRSSETPSASALKKELTRAQIDVLNSLEQFGWYLKFVRRDPPGPPKAILCDPDAHKFAILDELGELHENPVFEKFRQSCDD